MSAAAMQSLMERSLMLRKALVALILLTGAAQAQNAVRQTGVVTPGDIVLWANNEVVSSAAQRLSNTGLGGNPSTITDSLGPGLTLNSANTSGQYNSLTIGHDSNGNALFTVDSYGGLANKTAYLRLNGTLYPFPFSSGGITGPVSSTVNNVALWNNTNGTLLKDGGYPARPMITTLAALKAAATTSYDTVLKTGNLTSGDMSPAIYYASNTPCTENAGAGDNGGCIPSSNGKAWRLGDTLAYDPRWWGAIADNSTDAVASIAAAATWVGLNHPGAILDGGAQHYAIGANATPGVQLFPETHPVFWKNFFFTASAMTTTTDIWGVAPTLADTDGWGWDNITVYTPLNVGTWRHTWAFTDGGDNQKFIRGLIFSNVLVYPSQNRAGDDFHTIATDLGTGFLVQSTLGPNVQLFESFTCHNCGDSITMNGFTVATDGVVSPAKTCIDISLATSGAGEFVSNDLNCTAYGGGILTNLYGSHLNGGVFECEGAHIASVTGAFLTIIGSTETEIGKVQFQGGTCGTPPKGIDIDAGSRNIEGRPIIGGGMGTAYTVAAAAFPSTYLETFGHHANQGYFQANKNTNQTGIAANVPTTILFDVVNLDPTSAYNNGTGHYTPTVADGAYYIVATVCFNGTFAGGGAQILVTKNDVTVISAPSMVPPAGTPTQCLTGQGIAQMNGSTDFLDVRANLGLSAGTGTVEGSQTSTVSIWRLAP
jgi:hypothetical protein